MKTEVESKNAAISCIVEVDPADVEAGAEMTLKVRITCTPPRDLRRRTVEIRDGEGALVASAPITGFDGETSSVDDIVAKAPPRVGTYSWRAVLAGDGSREEVSGGFAFTVVAHGMRVVVWDVPSAVEVGTRFKVKIGVKCSGGCPMAGTVLGLHDHTGTQVATATLSDACWPGSEALHYTEVEVAAPGEEGQHAWEVRVAGPEADLPHAEGTARFGVRFAPPPECQVTVEARDADTQAPIKGAKVVMHPYRAFADESGLARLNVPKGSYRLFVSASHYSGIGLSVDVDRDMSTRTELVPEPPPDLAEGYY